MSKKSKNPNSEKLIQILKEPKNKDDQNKLARVMQLLNYAIKRENSEKITNYQNIVNKLLDEMFLKYKILTQKQINEINLQKELAAEQKKTDKTSNALSNNYQTTKADDDALKNLVEADAKEPNSSAINNSADLSAIQPNVLPTAVIANQKELAAATANQKKIAAAQEQYNKLFDEQDRQVVKERELKKDAYLAQQQKKKDDEEALQRQNEERRQQKKDAEEALQRQNEERRQQQN